MKAVIAAGMCGIQIPFQPSAKVGPALRSNVFGSSTTQRWRPRSRACAGLPSGTGAVWGGAPVPVGAAAQAHPPVPDAQEAAHHGEAVRCDPHWWLPASRVLVHGATACFMVNTGGQLMAGTALAAQTLAWVSCLSPLVSFFILSSTFIDDGEPEGIVCYMAGFLGCFALFAHVSRCSGRVVSLLRWHASSPPFGCSPKCVAAHMLVLAGVCTRSCAAGSVGDRQQFCCCIPGGECHQAKWGS